MNKRVLLLLTSHSYRAAPFLDAAGRLGVEVVKAVDMQPELAALWNERLGVAFDNPDAAAATIVGFAAEHPLDAIVAVDDSGSLLAARASAALGLPHNSPEAAEAARDKYSMRQLLKRGGVPIPEFRLCFTDEDLPTLAAQVSYPCVVKPLRLNGSRGVIRADDPDQFVAAAARLAALLHAIEPAPTPRPF
jgi:biotin carboxylase